MTLEIFASPYANPSSVTVVNTMDLPFGSSDSNSLPSPLYPKLEDITVRLDDLDESQHTMMIPSTNDKNTDPDLWTIPLNITQVSKPKITPHPTRASPREWQNFSFF